MPDTNPSLLARLPGRTAGLCLLLLGAQLPLGCRHTAPRTTDATGTPAAATSAPAAPLPPLQSRQALLEEGEEAWLHRDTRAQLQHSLAAFEQAFLLAPQDGALAAKLAHGYFLLADTFLRSDADAQAMAQAFARGLLIAEQALRSSDAGFLAALNAGTTFDAALATVARPATAALLAYLENLQGYAQLQGRTAELFYAERAKIGTQRLRKLDERYAGAAGLRIWAQWQLRLPAFAGGDSKAARAAFERAARLAPTSMVTLWTYARDFATTQQPLLRAQLLVRMRQAHVDASGDADNAAEQRLYQSLALPPPAAAENAAAAPPFVPVSPAN